MTKPNTIQIAKPSLGQEELKNVKKVFDTCWLGMGSFVYEFERKIQEYLNVKYAVCVNTGTTGIHLALAAIGIKPGDEVVVPSLTFTGSVQPILNLGAKPVFCEIEPDTLNIDVADAEKRITKKTKAIICVHYGGVSCNMSRLLSIGRKRKLYIVEDAAHAFGSYYGAKRIGSFGHLAVFSFDPIKNMTCGEGGCVTTNDPKLAVVLRRKRLLGISKDTWMRYKNKRSWYYEVVTGGYRYHMSNINAAIGLAQFDKLRRFIGRKKEIVAEYDNAFRPSQYIELLERNLDETAPFNYTIKIAGDRDKFINYMQKQGIGVGINYIPNHIQPYFRKFAKRLPVTERVWKKIASLPLYYGMSGDDVKKVIFYTKKYVNKLKRS